MDKILLLIPLIIIVFGGIFGNIAYQNSWIPQALAVKWCEENIDEGWGKRGYGATAYLECNHRFEEKICTQTGWDTKIYHATVTGVSISDDDKIFITTSDGMTLENIHHELLGRIPELGSTIVYEVTTRVYDVKIEKMYDEEQARQWHINAPDRVQIMHTYYTTIDRLESYPTHAGGQSLESCDAYDTALYDILRFQ